ncbi:unnamed protein product [Ceutorhynchus assimilis]|uniref:Muscleblind-like protein n=1 Tax=Ceutorhynchus assimilis TaxID=467358 RepID=A0A9N9MU12_9CUCU|nr:unnamed protein product [Ceutorhynchus assimilis]
MVPYKRPAADKSGVPVYQPNATTYQQLMQLQQPFVPVSCEYPTSAAPPPTSTASPSIPEAAAAVNPATSVATIQSPQAQAQPAQQPQPPQPLAQYSKENELQVPRSVTPLTNTTASLPAQPITVYHDPAALAKEVAQQNYAKALKLAAMNQSLANSHQMSQLNPLNYTGVTLNKQHLSIPPPTLRYPQGLPLGFGAAAGLNLGMQNPYSAALAQQSFFMGRPPPTTAAAFQFNPYSLMRPAVYANATSTASVVPSSMYGGGLLAQYPSPNVSTSPMTNVTPSAANIAAQNNNNVVMQPYKKLKTS